MSKKAPDPDEVGPLAAEVRRLRKKANLTQEQLSDFAELSRGTVSNIENGVYGSADATTLRKIAPHLGTTAEALFALAEETSSAGGRITSIPARTSGHGATVATTSGWPTGLLKWLTKRAGISHPEFVALTAYRSRPGDTPKDMESEAFWDRELEYVREVVRATAAVGSEGGAQGANPAESKRPSGGKPSH